jgi:hypothetical protein
MKEFAESVLSCGVGRESFVVGLAVIKMSDFLFQRRVIRAIQCKVILSSQEHS